MVFDPGLLLRPHDEQVSAHQFCPGHLQAILVNCGGFGFDQLLNDLGWTQARPHAEAVRPFRLGRWLLLALVIGCFADFFVHRRPDDLSNFTLKTCDQSFSDQWYAPLATWRLFIYAALLITVAFALLARLGKAPAGWSRKSPPGMFAVYLADVSFFYLCIVRQGPFCPPGISMGHSFDISELTYSPERVFKMTFPHGRPQRVNDIIRVIVSPRDGFFNKWSSIYSSLYLLMRIDELEPQWRLDQIMPGVKQMIEARGGQVPGDAPAILLPEEQDPSFVRSLGHGAPKIRIVRDAVFAETNEEALRFFTRNDEKCKVQDAWQTIVVTGKSQAATDHPSRTPTPDTVEVIHFSANRMVVKTSAKEPGWLFCADAFHPYVARDRELRAGGSVPRKCRLQGCLRSARASEIEFFCAGGSRGLGFAAESDMGSMMGFILTATIGLFLFKNR